MKSLFDTLNIVYGEQEKRGFFKLNAMSLAFTVGGIVFILAALGGIVAVPVLLQNVGLSNVADLLLRIGRWPALFVVLALALACIYRFGPKRRRGGDGSLGAVRPQPCSGCRHPDCSPSTRPTSEASKRTTAHWAP